MVGKNVLLSLLIVWALFAASPAPAIAQVLGDDFNDLNDDGWTHSRTAEGETWGPGIFDASSGAYNLTTTGLVPSQGLGVLTTFWDVSADPFYNNGLWRATVRAESTGNNVGFLLRGGEDSPGSYLVSTTINGRVEVYDCRGLNCTYLDGGQSGFTPGEDWILEAGAVENLIFAKMWRRGNDEPQNPVVIVQNGTYPMGQFGVVTFIGTAWTQPAQVNATFDAIQFTPLSTAVAGDYNANGIVDQGDLDLVLLNWGTRYGLFTLLGKGWYNDRPSSLIDQEELDAILLNWGNGVASATFSPASVPEPSAIVIGCLCLLWILTSLRRSSRQ